jgi:predicted Zn-dependent protease
MKKVLFVAGVLALLACGQAAATELQLPPFLPDYYLPAFQLGEKQLVLNKQTEAKGVEQFFYSTQDESTSLFLDNIKCDRPRCKAVLDNLVAYLNKEFTQKKGEFREITRKEIHGRMWQAGMAKRISVYVLPASVQIWGYVTAPQDAPFVEDKFRLIRGFENRQRYNEALSAGNVDMGFWGPEIYDYAAQLLKERRKTEALSVLNNLLATSPFNYEAHIDLMENTNDVTAAKRSARTVFEGSEDPKLIEKAAKHLQIPLKTLNSIPMVNPGETGLKLILIPLPPCDPWLLDDAAQTYEKITGVPVHVRRLGAEWTWGTPERISRQREVQSLLIKVKKQNVNFAGWTKADYARELSKAVESDNAMNKYGVKRLIDRIEKEPGQYSADPYVSRLSSILEKYRSNDTRTMYVGITEANIYSGDNNYVFSLHVAYPKSQASILSYHMMLAKNLSEEYPSRQRLTERIAKELVPASLKSLGIPRSTDPRCPYSYSDSVARLDQKTLNLSDTVKDALNKLKAR